MNIPEIIAEIRKTILEEDALSHCAYGDATVGDLVAICDSLDALEKDKERLVNTNLETMKQIADLHTKDSARTKEHNILTQENRAQAKEIAELKAERDSLEKQVAMDTECIERLRAHGLTLEKEIAGLKEERSQERQDYDVLRIQKDNEIRALKNENDRLKESLAYHKKLCIPKTLGEIEAVNLRSLVQDQELDLGILTAERDRLKAELAEAKAGLNGSAARSQAFEEMLRDSLAERDRLKDEIGGKTIEAARLRKDRDELCAEVARLQKERDDALASLDKALTQGNTALRERDADKARLDWLFAALDDNMIASNIRRVSLFHASGAGRGIKCGDFRAAIDAARREQ